MDHLDCAAFLASEENLIQSGTVEAEGDFRNRVYLTMMWYINAHAIPQGISESDAFEQLKARSEDILEREDPEGIDRIARKCIDELPDRVPQAGEAMKRGQL